MVFNMTEASLSDVAGGGYVLYTSTTCSMCPLAKRKLANAGVDHEVIVLDEAGNERILEVFRATMTELGKPQQVPVLVTPVGDILTNLATISDHFRKRDAA